jgi:hypothetical protein
MNPPDQLQDQSVLDIAACNARAVTVIPFVIAIPHNA